ncbi:MAG: glycogen/starch/alpha-glucan phosphorylase [Deltaproteobacteria bacterium]|nr:glycogen/starch/alpha-glucan phosphorylase [Deltaproteobacteria bacterium]
MTAPALPEAEDLLGTDVASLRESVLRHVRFSIGKAWSSATALDHYQALSLSVRDHLISRWIETQSHYYQVDPRRVYYLSLEYLMGRTLRNAVINLGLYNEYTRALSSLGLSFDELEELESDAALGNGGLGRLAACFLDSMATMGIPGYGYGIRYDYGIFRQVIENGHQVEEPDDWLRFPNPWEVRRPEHFMKVQLGGRVETYDAGAGEPLYRWCDTNDVLATAYDTPIPGYGGRTVNTLRLWRATASEMFDLTDFNVGDYIGAVEHMVLSRTISRVLYPNDNFYQGQELRLKQQYFLVSSSLQDVVRRHLVDHPSLDNLPEKAVFQLNDTHPALAIPELMRLLVDVHGYGWAQAWSITSRCMAYTNHTLLPEALEAWSVELIGRLFPRHLLIINRINQEFLEDVGRRFPGNLALQRRVSVYEEGNPKRIRMAHLATIGSYSVNGVAALHTELLKSRVLSDFHQIFPERFNNKTNGVTQRRWLLSANPELSRVVTQVAGERWITDLDQLRVLSRQAGDAALQERVAAAKHATKERLATRLRWYHGFNLNPDSIFDVHVKRIHEYKRQLLNVLHIIHLYCELERRPNALKTPRTFIFAGKAAPGYAMAKLIVKLINDVGAKINAHPEISRSLKVFFVPDYSVSIAELLFPAADVSEQISTAGFEASGTGNMKFMLNGGITVGTLDGANVEMADEVGRDNIFIFGLTVEEVTALRKTGYRPREICEDNPRLKEVIELLATDHFNPREPGLFQPIVQALMHTDYYLHFADFEAYRTAHLAIDACFAEKSVWRKMMIENVARVGRFSSDRTIRQYATEIWKTTPCPVP